VAALATPVAVVAPASADPLPPYVVAGRGPSGFAYYNPVVAVPVGGSLTMVSADIDRHNIVSAAAGPDTNPWCITYQPGQCPLFWSQLVNALPASGGPTTEVQGLGALEALTTYDFFCTLHPEMEGTLLALPELPPSSPEGPYGTAATLPPSVPAGYAVTVGAAAAAPTALAFSPGGDTLYVTSLAGQVHAYPVVDGLVAGAPAVFLDGLVQPLGVIAADLDGDGVDEVFVSDKEFNPATNRDDGKVLRARDTDGDGAADVVQPVVTGLPNGRHNTNGMALGPLDGLLYVANGNSTDSGFGNEGGHPEVRPYSGSLLRVDPTATGLTPAGAEVVGTGWRNIYDVAFAPAGTPLNPDGSAQVAAVPMNGPDGQTYGGVTRPRGEDTLSILDVGGPVEHFGFPWCLFDRDRGGLDGFTQDPGQGSCDALPAAAFAGLPAGGVVQATPSALFGMHVSADGAAFDPATGDLFVAEWGNLFGDEAAGHKVVRVRFAPDGSVRSVTDFMTGVVPIDLTFAPDGSLWVADMGGAVHRVSALPL
jgi:glucose/arabinose dehydrogenase